MKTYWRMNITYRIPVYKIIREKYDDLLGGHDNLSVIFKCPPRKAST